MFTFATVERDRAFRVEIVRRADEGFSVSLCYPGRTPEHMAGFFECLPISYIAIQMRPRVIRHGGIRSETVKMTITDVPTSQTLGCYTLLYI